jgi:hypothetical protein
MHLTSPSWTGASQIKHMVDSKAWWYGSLQHWRKAPKLINHKYLAYKKQDEQRSLCDPGIATCLNPLRTTAYLL